MPDKSEELLDHDEESAQEKLSAIDPSEDGRGKEWQDRARVNLEQVQEGTRTNIERDFEPEEKPAKKKDDPAY